MSWEKTLLDASFRGVVFDCMRTQDNAQRDTTSHEYPYKDGADVEDLGRKARQIQISAIFYGTDYETRLQKFISELDRPGQGELIHPVFGSIKHAQLLSYSIGHDADSPDYCTVDLQFIDATPGNPFFVRQLPAQRAAAVSLLAGTARLSAISAFAGKLGSLKSMASGMLSPLTALRGVLTGTLGAIRSQITGFIGSGLDLLNFPRAFAGDLVGMVSGLANLRGFGISTLKSDWKSLVGQLKSVVQLPRSISSLSGGSSGGTPGSSSSGGSSGGTPGSSSSGGSSGGTPGSGSSGGSSGGTPGSGSSGGSSGGTPGSNSSGGSSGGTPGSRSSGGSSGGMPAEPAHVALVTALVQTVVATELAETAASIFTDETEEPTLSPVEIEQISNDVRESLQASIDAWRDLLPIEEARPVIEALRTTALGIQQAAAAVIEALPPLVTRRVEAPGNLHLIAFRWYGDYSRAGELARLNPQIVNPNRLMPGDALYAYAR
ncbi:DNA circularization protein [Microvirgula aerodenitrificans]|uniref:DNA circularization protein n=1 Tax=Microvirgula aerodenitrificans TaxID=57480 RepID=UPI00048AF83F|nr:DNA circularization N-terminal domain-containing protein [Microvirgula aerodenitrificans]